MVTVEYALLLMLGVIPLLMLLFTGVMMFAAQQSLSLASAEGARASLRYGTTAERRSAACMAAKGSMEWLLTYSGSQANCASADGAPVAVSQPFACAGTPDRQCMQVTVSFDYDDHPFVPGTATMMGWFLGRDMRSTAVAQLDLGE
ncbi:TadE-like protein [Pseudoxanthomonas sp. GM95]|nr:TadE-like protein [Pseudoxanthomonas sp. GM95]